MTTARKKLIAVLTFLGLCLGTWLYVLKRNQDKLTVPDNASIKDLKLSLSEVKNDTKIALQLDNINKKLKASALEPFNRSMWTLNYAEGEFANPNFVPLSNFRSANRFSFTSFEANKTKIKALWDLHRDVIVRQSEIWKVPTYLILGFMSIENLPGNPLALSDAKAIYTRDIFTGTNANLEYNKAVGLLQIKPYTATDSLRIAMKNGILQESQAICLQELSTTKRIDKALSKSDLGDIIITRELLQEAEFNLAVGCAKLATLMLKYNTELYKIAADFFQGDYFISNKRLNGYKTYETFASKLTSEVVEYVDSLCGKYGTLDIIVNHLEIKD